MTKNTFTDKDRAVVEQVTNRVETVLYLLGTLPNLDDAPGANDTLGDIYDELQAAITELNILLIEDRRALDDPNQYDLPLAGGFMFADDEPPLDFQGECR